MELESLNKFYSLKDFPKEKKEPVVAIENSAIISVLHSEIKISAFNIIDGKAYWTHRYFYGANGEVNCAIYSRKTLIDVLQLCDTDYLLFKIEEENLVIYSKDENGVKSKWKIPTYPLYDFPEMKKENV